MIDETRCRAPRWHRAHRRAAPPRVPLRPREPAGREPLVGPAPARALHRHPLFALDLALAPIWAHSFLMLFTVFPTFFLGFLFTTYPRWMNGPLVPRGAYVARTAAADGRQRVAGWSACTPASCCNWSPRPWRPPDSQPHSSRCCACCSMRSRSCRTRSSPARHSRSASCAPPASATACGPPATSCCTSPCAPRCGASCCRCSSRSATA